MSAAPARIDAPRFDLLFESGTCRARARAEVAAGGLRVEDLTLEFDLPRPFDLSGGAARMRNVRSALVSMRVRAGFDALAAAARTAGVVLRLRPERDGVRLDVRDDVGCLSALFDVFVHEAEICVAVQEMSWSREGPSAPWERLRALLVRLTLSFDPGSGTFRIERPLRRILAEVLLPHGWRLPDDRDAGLDVTIERGGVVLQCAGERSDSPRLESARRRAETLGALARGDRPREDVRPWMKAAVRGGASASIRALARSGCSEASLEAFARAERSSWVRAEGVLDVAARGELDPACADAVLRALATFPSAAPRWREWAQRFGDAGDPTALRIADACLAGPLPRVTRAEIVATAILGMVDASPELDDDSEARLAELAARARRDAPRLAGAVAADAAARERRGEAGAAAEAYASAASLENDTKRRGEWRRRAAELFLGSKGPAAAQPLLEQALVDLDGDPQVVQSLARVLAERGDFERASEMLGRLLRTPGEGDAYADALLGAARFHIERGSPDRAAPFLAALGDPRSSSSRSEKAGSSSTRASGIADDAVRDGFEVDDADELDDAESAVLDDEPANDARPLTGTHRAPSGFEALRPGRPEVTLVSVADDDVRALLEEARIADDPTALLEGALEEALEAANAEGVRQVLRVLDRLERRLPGEESLRARGEKLLQRLGEDE